MSATAQPPPKFNQPNPTGGSNSPLASIGPANEQDWTQLYRWFNSLLLVVNAQAQQIATLQAQVSALMGG